MARATFRYLIENYQTRGLLALLLSGTNPDGSDLTLPLNLGSIALNGSDIEIGAVELKDGTTDARAPVSATNGVAVDVRTLAPNAAQESGGNLAAILAKLSSDPATQTTLAQILTALGTNHTDETQLHADIATTLHGDLATIAGKDFATQTTLALVLAACQAATPAGENHVGAVGGHTARVSATFNRPADTNAYASGDLVANNTVANSVVPMSFAISRAAGKGGMVRRVRIRKTSTTLTNAQFRLHLYTVSPVQTGGAGASTGDNAAWLTDNAANYVGAFDVTLDKAFTDGAAGNGAPMVGSEINFTSDTYYGLLEARAGYAPGNAEQFTVELEVLQN